MKRWIWLSAFVILTACGAGAQGIGVTARVICVDVDYAAGSIISEIIATFTKASTEIFFGNSTGHEDEAVLLNISVIKSGCPATVTASLPVDWVFSPGSVVTLGQLTNWTVTPPLNWTGTQQITFTVVAD